ncbi:MAG: anti-sigma factor family protein [Planctomycetota bacterium]
MNADDPRMRLLTGYLDGELGLAEKKKLKRFLKSNPEALKTFQKLRADKKALAALPMPVLPVDFGRTVQSALEKRKVKEISKCAPHGKSSAVTPIESMSWVAWIAFSIAWLAGLSFMAGWFFSAGTRVNELATISVNQDDNNSENLPRKEGTPDFSRSLIAGTGGIETPVDEWTDWLAPETPPMVAKSDMADPFLQGASLPTQNPGNPENEMGLLGAPAVRAGQLKELSLNLPKILSWNELADMKQVLKALKDSSGTVQVDIPASEPGHAVDSLIAVLKSMRRGVLIDSLAMDRLRRGQIRANYMVVIEDVDDNQLKAIVDALKAADSKLSSGKSGRFGPSLVVSPPDAARKQLKSMTGWDLSLETPNRQIRPPIVKDLGTDTVQQAIKAVEVGGNFRPAPGSPSVIPSALVMVFSPYYPAVKTQPQSVEVKRFVEIRQATTKPPAGRAILLFRGG